MTAPSPTPLLLTAFGLPHAMGYLETENGERAAPPLPVPELMRRARELGLAGVEIPLFHFCSITICVPRISPNPMSCGLPL
jgi:hypothetical protein